MYTITVTGASDKMISCYNRAKKKADKLHKHYYISVPLFFPKRAEAIKFFDDTFVIKIYTASEEAINKLVNKIKKPGINITVEHEDSSVKDQINYTHQLAVDILHGNIDPDDLSEYDRRRIHSMLNCGQLILEGICQCF